MKSTIRRKYITLAILVGLSMGFIISSCSKSGGGGTPVVTTGLAAEIDTAQTVSASTSEGTQPGEYTVGSKTSLNAAITAAQAVLSSSSSTQSDITNATANLAAAVATYRGNLISPIAPTALVAYWKFNGNPNDSSGNGHNGVLTLPPAAIGGQTLFHLQGASVPDPNAVPGGVPNLVNDRFGNPNSAYHFNMGGHIEVPYSTALNPTAITLSLWVRQDTAGRVDNPSDCYMIGLNRWNGYKFQMQPSYPFLTVTTINGGADCAASSAIPIGTTVGAGPWKHLVVTYDGVGTTTFYLNGTVFPGANGGAQATGPMKTINPTCNLSIGTDLANAAYKEDNSNNIEWGGFWSGDMDDVMIYNVALTAPQVLALYNQQKTP